MNRKLLAEICGVKPDNPDVRQVVERRASRSRAMLSVGLITGPLVHELERAVCAAHREDGLVHRLLLDALRNVKAARELLYSKGGA